MANCCQTAIAGSSDSKADCSASEISRIYPFKFYRDRISDLDLQLPFQSATNGKEFCDIRQGSW
jgi:hypothetical protein